MMKLTPYQIAKIIEEAEGQALPGIWYQINDLNASFEEKKYLFFDVLKTAMTEDRVRLHKNGELCKGCIDDQLNVFLKLWPKSESETPGYPDFDFGYWFFSSLCPVSIAWKIQNQWLFS